MAQPVAPRGTSRGEAPAHPGRRARAVVARLGLVLAISGPAGAGAATLDEARALFRTGQYDACASAAIGELALRGFDEPWVELKVRADLARGKLDEATATIREANRRFPWSVPIRLLAREVALAAGRDAEAAGELDAVERLVRGDPRRFASPEGLVALGRFALLRGADARQVLDVFYDPAARRDPDLVEAPLAIAELALDKQDFALAAEALGKAPAEAADDPRFHYLRARAFAEDDRAKAAEALARALEINPRHVDSLLFQADREVDGEKYAEARTTLDAALAVNPIEPRAHAYRAVLAHLEGDRPAELEARAKALDPRKTNPEVDHLIGRKLSQKYRFAEGSVYQRSALEAAPDYLPAKLQLCQDLLRLGEEDEGWRLAAEVFEADGYNVVAYNLVTLRDHLAGFRTLEGDGFLVRMDPREADLYGERVLELLSEARATLTKEYEAEAPDPVIVEIFPQRKDFAVRTFGLPGAGGVLGVCFGRVVTAISPAAQGESPSNWEAVLWHEFCHALTLTKTKHTMPRWLSEGISVYEESRRDPAWGMAPIPRYRERLLADDLTPLSGLSAAFLTAKTAQDVQFAYFESALAVEFLVEKAGRAALNGLLDDLGAGQSLGEALPRRAGMSLEELDREFAAFARARAGRIAPGATWDEPDLPREADSALLRAWLAEHPDSFPGLRRLAARLVAEQEWDEALEAIETLRDAYPEYVGPENAYVLSAQVHRSRSDPQAERAALEALAARDGDATAAYLRLAELAEAEGDWPAVEANARRLRAVNPLVPATHRLLGRSAEALDRPAEAIRAYRALALVDDSDPAGLHFRLATLLKQAGEPDQARREVLKALEEAPRFRDAHRLLLELARPEPETEPQGDQP